MIYLMTALMGNAVAGDLAAAETSFIGATMLESNSEVWFDPAGVVALEDSTASYAYFNGNSLYIGAEDDDGNTVDAIVEFFWFQSSVDRGSDFYVAVIKARSNPSMSDELWITDWNDWGLTGYPVLSVEALTDVSREKGSFRWDWSLPFQDYGIDAYSQITFTNQYGLGGGAGAEAGAEGSAMLHGEYQKTAEGDVKAAGNVQTKGYVNTEYRVQTQYDVTLYEWDVFVDGRADIMAWDMYLNLEARAEQSAYHEYFLSIQVDEGETFVLDGINILGNFDTSWWNPLARTELGVSISGIEIAPPYYEEPLEPSSEPSEEPVEEPESEDTAVEEEGDSGFSEPSQEELELDGQTPAPVKTGCTSVVNSLWLGLLAVPFVFRRKE